MAESDNTARRGPLQGIRVVETGSMIAGPFCGHLLADYGAEVIKVEPPGEGDVMRRWGGLYKGLGLYWPIISRNKKSITLDLRVADGQALLKQLVERADVLVENFRPGTLERWSLGFEHLSAANPRLVMVRVTGYGQTGPYRHKAGFAAIGEAMAGLRYLSGEPGRPPVRAGVSIGDSLAATFGAMGALLALYSRDRPGGSGRGQVVDVAIYEAVWAFMESILPEYEKLGRVRQPSGATLPGIAPSSVYPTRDGDWIVMGANADTVFRRLAVAIEHPEWAEDERFSTFVGRGQNQELLDGLIAEWTSQRTVDEGLALLDEASIPAGRLYTAVDIGRDEHFKAREMILSVFDSQLDEEVRQQGVVPKLNETPGLVWSSGPALGQHNQEVYGDLLGLDLARLAELQRLEVI